MAIVFYKYKTPINVSDVSDVDLETSLVFATKREVPAGFSINITPEGYRDKYTLKTKTDPQNPREDTIAEIKVNRQGGQKVSAFSMGAEGGSAPIEIEATESFFSIDSKNPIFILARPNVLDGGDGIRIDGIVRYEPS